MRSNLASLLALSLLASCGGAASDPESNPFLEDQSTDGKEDSAYLNPDGVEVEVDIEADVQASSYQIWDAPAQSGQFALTYLRKRGTFYLESLAEDASSDQRVEWLVDGTWLTAAQAHSVAVAKLTHFRIKGINAVLLDNAADGVTEGTVFTAKVPLKPYSVMSDAGAACADPDDHMSLDASVYWYMWNPDLSTCKVTTRDMTVTVARILPVTRTVYPEFDQLVADGKVTAVVLFGQIDDGAITDSEPGVRNMKKMATWLKQGGYKEITPAPVGRRFQKTIGTVVMEIDLYSPRDFAGLDDMAHFANFQKAISEHEIVAYDGHSMLGASDFWSRPTYPSFYQIYLYGGCLGYEYYVRPILAGKGGWDKVDIMSAVVEVSADANLFAAPALAKIAYALNHKYKVSWTQILTAVRAKVGDSTFGVSGVRDNCFSPAGSYCTAPQPTTGQRYENSTAVAIPDASTAGVTSTITVPDTITAQTVTLELDVSHTYVGDLTITISHDGVTQTVWAEEGDSADDIKKTFTLDKFAGKAAKGTWTLKLVDGYAQDAGTLNKWALTIQ
jgi:hypothetical protein